MRDVSRLAQTCFFHLRRLRSVRHQVGQDVTERLVCALVLSRLDYCNTVLAGLPASNLAPFATLGTLNSEVGYELVLGTRWFGYELAVKVKVKEADLYSARDVNTRLLGYPGPVWPTRVPTRVP